MPRIRSLYIAEMRERFEVVDRKKASPEEKASLTGALQEDARTSSPEVSPSKDNTLRKDDEDKAKLRLSFVDDDEKGDLKKAEDGSEAAEAKNEEGEDEDDINEEDIEAGSHKLRKRSSPRPRPVSSLYYVDLSEPFIQRNFWYLFPNAK